ncbi:MULTISPECIES: CHAD domain-containing protein [unclassified Sinorhizobium]|uniref:CHAD domain-containing protein n=1 Tax=unclassified Sinorhizobium TaxID=2613772 RepID=UPI0024C2D2C7|nr:MULTISPECIES: CHAD domain-containing protein [unclassified Sinorhizobium]MDK1375369.1 CHAD domain-containing protein [Sinorhizobium sp. 6-70]MDK1477963.1 CHAD domain-containing protein [Sinorhizobium sp. 6-117]
MSYAFRPDRPFTEDFRTVGAEQIERAVAALEQRPQGVHEAIHDARKNFKRLRSLYRLVASDAPLFQKQENARIRAMGRNLSTVRDAAALVENINYLRGQTQSDEQGTALDQIYTILAERRDRVAESETDIEGKIAATIVDCEQALDALAQVSFDDGKRKSAARLKKGWRRTLKRAARARAACEAHTEAALFHELRKRAQDYRLQLALMRQAWPSAMEAKRAEAKALVDVLGHLNDLATLTSLVNEEPGVAGSSQNRAHLMSAVTTREEALKKEARQRAAAVFRDKPKSESRTVALLWLEAGR